MYEYGNSAIEDYYWVIIVVLVCLIAFTGALFWYIRKCRRQPRYDYTALEDDALLNDRLEMDRKLQRDSDRNMAMMHCQYYLRGSSRYIYLRQMSDIGSRAGKNWFLVRDTATKTERILTMTHLIENCPIIFTCATRPVLLELLLSIQHPYIYPVLDVDRKIITEQEFVITVTPYNENGSLKDLIFRSQCQNEYKAKYENIGCGLPISQIQRLSCQILEALLFLKDHRFPPFTHLHSGNVILQNGVARLSGLEKVLLGYVSRYYLLLPKKIYENKETVEIVSFGHVIFEMAAGYELRCCFPTEKNYCDIEMYPQVFEVMKFIFEQEHNRYPTLRQLSTLEFFRHIDLRELPLPLFVFRGNLSQDARNLLKEIKRHQRLKKRSKRSQSLSTLETASIDSKESTGTNRYVRKKKKYAITTSETSDQLSTQMQTLPLPDIEGSVTTSSQSQTSREAESHGLQTSVQQPTLHPLLLQEIQSGFKFKHARDRDPQV